MILNEQMEGNINKDLIYYDDTVSMLQRTTYRVYPIIQEINSRMIKEKEIGLDENLLSSVTQT